MVIYYLIICLPFYHYITLKSRLKIYFYETCILYRYFKRNYSKIC